VSARLVPIAVWLACALGVACAREPARCALCRMVVPAETVTIAAIDGHRQTICDPRCALTYRQQTGRGVRLERVTDLETGDALDPRTATYVTGSDLAPDAPSAERTGMRMWPAAQASLQWHRCLPSVLAFRSEDAALRFVAAHGGRLAAYDTLGFGKADTPGAARSATTPGPR
jgi:hypothetical protein